MPNIVEIIITGTDKFTEVGKKVNEEVDKLGSSSMSMGDKVAKGFDIAGKATLALGGAALAGIGKAVEEYAKYGEQVLQVQRITGATAEESSHLIFAANETGVAYETLTRSLGLFSKNMLVVQEQDAGFTSSLNTNEKILKSIGITALDAAGNVRPLPDLLGDLADKFHGMSNSGEKSGLALQLFGRNGAALLPFLNQGREGIAALNEEADKLGVTLSQKDVDAAHQLVLAQRQLEESLKGVEIQVAQKVVPGFTQLTRAFSEGMQSGDAFHKLMQGIAFGLAALWFDAMGLIANQVESVFERIVKAAAAAFNWIAEKANSISNLVPVIGGDIAPTTNLSTYNFHLQRADMADPLQGLKKLFPDITKETKDFGQQVGDATPPLANFAKETKTATDRMKEGMDLLSSARNDLFSKPTIERATQDLNIDRLQMTVDSLNNKFQPTTDKLDDFKKGLSEAKDKLSDWGDDISRRKTVVSDAQQGVQDRIDALKERQGDLNDKNDPGNKQRTAIDAQVNFGERQLKGMELANRQLDLEDRARQKQEKQLDLQDRLADRQKDTIEKQITLAQRALSAQQSLSKLDDDKNKIMQDELTLADKTLLSSKERDQLYAQLLKDTANVSGRIRDAATRLGVDLIPSIQKVHQVAMTSGDILKAIANVADKQNQAAAAADRLTTSLDGAATKMATVPGSILAAITGGKTYFDRASNMLLKGGGQQSIKPPNVGDAGLALRQAGYSR